MSYLFRSPFKNKSTGRAQTSNIKKSDEWAPKNNDDQHNYFCHLWDVYWWTFLRTKRNWHKVRHVRKGGLHFVWKFLLYTPFFQPANVTPKTTEYSTLPEIAGRQSNIKRLTRRYKRKKNRHSSNHSDDGQRYYVKWQKIIILRRRSGGANANEARRSSSV